MHPSICTLLALECFILKLASGSYFKLDIPPTGCEVHIRLLANSVTMGPILSSILQDNSEIQKFVWKVSNRFVMQNSNSRFALCFLSMFIEGNSISLPLLETAVK